MITQALRDLKWAVGTLGRQITLLQVVTLRQDGLPLQAHICLCIEQEGHPIQFQGGTQIQQVEYLEQFGTPQHNLIGHQVGQSIHRR